MSEETFGLSPEQFEKAKRYLQWATLLALVSVVVLALDLMIKNQILKAAERTQQRGQFGPASGVGVPPNRDGHTRFAMADTSGASENGSQDANGQPPSVATPADSTEDKSPSDELRVDG